MRMVSALGAFRVPGVILTREERRKLGYAAKTIPRGAGLGGLSMLGNGSAPATFMGGGQNVESILDTDRGPGEMRDGFPIAQLFGRFTGMKDFEKAAKDPTQSKLARRSQSLAGAVLAVLARTPPAQRVPDLEKLLGIRVAREVMQMSIQLKPMGENDAVGFGLSMAFLTGALDAEQKSPTPYALAYLNTYRQFIAFLDRRKDDPRAKKMRSALGGLGLTSAITAASAAASAASSTASAPITSTNPIVASSASPLQLAPLPPTFPKPVGSALEVRRAVAYFNELRSRSLADLQQGLAEDPPVSVITSGPYDPYAYRFAMWAAYTYKTQIKGPIDFNIVNSAIAQQTADVTVTTDQLTAALYDLQRYIATRTAGLVTKFALARGGSPADAFSGKAPGVTIQIRILQENQPTVSWLLDAKTIRYNRDATFAPGYDDAADITLNYVGRENFIGAITNPQRNILFVWNNMIATRKLVVQTALPKEQRDTILDLLTTDVFIPSAKTPPVARPVDVATPALSLLPPEQLLATLGTTPTDWFTYPDAAARPVEWIASLRFAALCMLWGFERRYGDVFAENDLGTAERTPKSIVTVNVRQVWKTIFDLASSPWLYSITSGGQGSLFDDVASYDRVWPEIKRQAALVRAGKDSPGYKALLPDNASSYGFSVAEANTGITFSGMTKPQRDAARLAGWIVDQFGEKLKPLFLAMAYISNDWGRATLQTWFATMVKAADQCTGGFSSTPGTNLLAGLRFTPRLYGPNESLTGPDENYVLAAEGVSDKARIREVAMYSRFVVIAIEVARRYAWTYSGVIPDVGAVPPVPVGGEAFEKPDCNLGWDKREAAAVKYRSEMLREPTPQAVNWYAPFLKGYSVKAMEGLRLSGSPPPPDFITPEKSFFEKLADNVGKFFSNAFAYLADAAEAAINFLCRGFRFLLGDTIGGFFCTVITVLTKLVVGGIATGLAILKQCIEVVIKVIGHITQGKWMDAAFDIFSSLNTVLFLALGGPIAYMVDIPLTYGEQDRLKRKAIARGADPAKIPPSFEELGEKLAKSCPMFIINLAMAIINLILVGYATGVTGGAAEAASAATAAASAATGAASGGSPMRTAVGGIIMALAPGVAVFVEPQLRIALRSFDVTKEYADERLFVSEEFNRATEQLIKLITMVIMGILGMSDIISQVTEKLKTFLTAKGGLTSAVTDAFKDANPTSPTVADTWTVVKDVLTKLWKAITSMSLKTIGEALIAVGKLLAFILGAFIGMPKIPPELLALQADFQKIYSEGAKTVEQAKKAWGEISKGLSEVDKRKLAEDLGVKQDAEAQRAAEAEAQRQAAEYERQVREMQAAEAAQRAEAQRIANEKAALMAENARLRQQLAERGSGSTGTGTGSGGGNTYTPPGAAVTKTNTGMILGAAAVAGLAVVMLSGRRT